MPIANYLPDTNFTLILPVNYRLKSSCRCVEERESVRVGAEVTDSFDWEDIYEKEAPVLYGYLLKKVEQQVAEDLLQESFLRLFDMAKTKGAPRNPRAYLFQIARNLVIDLYSQRQIQTEIGEKSQLISHRDTGDKALERKEIQAILNQALAQLDTREAEVFDLRWNQDMSSEDIAIVIGASDRHVRRILEKSSQKIADLFRQKGWGVEHVFSE